MEPTDRPLSMDFDTVVPSVPQDSPTTPKPELDELEAELTTLSQQTAEETQALKQRCEEEEKQIRDLEMDIDDVKQELDRVQGLEDRVKEVNATCKMLEEQAADQRDQAKALQESLAEAAAHQQLATGLAGRSQSAPMPAVGAPSVCSAGSFAPYSPARSTATYGDGTAGRMRIMFHNAERSQDDIARSKRALSDALQQQMKEREERRRKEKMAERDESDVGYFNFGRPGSGAALRDWNGDVVANVSFTRDNWHKAALANRSRSTA